MPTDPMAMAGVARPAPAHDGLADRMRSAAERGDDASLEKAARGFEAYFVREMLASMRSSSEVLGDGLFDSSATDTWTEQLDAAVADDISAGPGIGLARMIVRSMHEQQGASRPGAPARVDGVRRQGWSWPLPEQGSISSGFGLREHPVSGSHRMHHGLDLAAPEGTPVLAASAGRVVHAGPAGAYGLLVEIDHGDGIVTRYAHQSAIVVAVGDEVEAGTPLGAVGSTGRSTGPHLHFEVRRGGAPVDPVTYQGSLND